VNHPVADCGDFIFIPNHPVFGMQQNVDDIFDGGGMIQNFATDFDFFAIVAQEIQ